MDKQQVVFQKIKELIVQEFTAKPEIVTMDACLAKDFGVDSLDALELFNEIEGEFLISISDEVALQMKTVLDLVNYVVETAGDSYFE
ncbi:MAG: acyl carrier protein [Bacilli bacterium]|nr:acyl carrier protein [Bacilli bacterium]MBN2876095.1 acyl carrier protein [Bacilli bacterium]